MIRFLALMAALLMPIAATAEQVVAGLSQNRVAITASFDGSEILVFGAVKRDAPMPEGPIEVIVTVSGPVQPVTVRKKGRQMGIWINTVAVDIGTAPSFYAVASSTGINTAINDATDRRLRVSLDRAINTERIAGRVINGAEFTEALIRLRREQGLYQLNENAVTLAEDTLFRTAINLPANITEGAYNARIFLTRAGNVIDQYETTIQVSKVGMERWLFNLAHERALYYALLSLLIAVVAGWGASEIVRLARR